MKTGTDLTGNTGRHGKSNGAAARVAKADGLAAASADTSLPLDEMIAVAAYFRAEHRGFTPGNEIDDWLEAKAEVEASLGLRRD